MPDLQAVQNMPAGGETVQRRIDAVIGPGVIEVRGLADEKAVVDRAAWIERYAATHPADPAPVDVPTMLAAE